SLLRLLKVSQIGRRLMLFCRHQIAVRTEHIVLLADLHESLALGTIRLYPYRSRIRQSPVGLGHRPRTCQRIINDRDLIMEQVLIGLAERDALLDHGLVILMQGNATDVDGARTFETTRFDFEDVVTTIPILIDPFSMRKTEERGLDCLWP